MRSSWLASATKRRIRSSLARASDSDASRARNADSIWSTIPLKALESRPTSVRGSLSGTRRDRSPAAISAAVVSTSSSGRSDVRTTT